MYLQFIDPHKHSVQAASVQISPRIKAVKAIALTIHGGSYGCKALGLQYFLDNWQ
jgi:hypothetical protein